MSYWIYVLSSNHHTVLYIGVTNDLIRRVYEHKKYKISGFTQKYMCHKLVYFEEYLDIKEAIKREKQLKKWSRTKKEKLISTVNPKSRDLYPKIV